MLLFILVLPFVCGRTIEEMVTKAGQISDIVEASLELLNVNGLANDLGNLATLEAALSDQQPIPPCRQNMADLVPTTSTGLQCYFWPATMRAERKTITVTLDKNKKFSWSKNLGKNRVGFSLIPRVASPLLEKAYEKILTDKKPYQRKDINFLIILDENKSIMALYLLFPADISSDKLSLVMRLGENPSEGFKRKFDEYKNDPTKILRKDVLTILLDRISNEKIKLPNLILDMKYHIKVDPEAEGLMEMLQAAEFLQRGPISR